MPCALCAPLAIRLQYSCEKAGPIRQMAHSAGMSGRTMPELGSSLRRRGDDRACEDQSPTYCGRRGNAPKETNSARPGWRRSWAQRAPACAGLGAHSNRLLGAPRLTHLWIGRATCGQLCGSTRVAFGFYFAAIEAHAVRRPLQ
jgi:hypothetical protein